MLLISGSFLLPVIVLILPQKDVVCSFSSPSASCNFDTWGTLKTGSTGSSSSPAVVGKQTLQLSDSKRQDRPLTIDVWYPAVENGEALTRYNPLLPSDGFYFKALEDPAVDDPSAAETTFPLLMFSHGFGGLRSQSATLMEHLASWGFVVAAPDHTGNSYNDDPSQDFSFESKDRPLDISFVIDSLLSSPYKEEFRLSSSDDPSKVGVLGNSYGGLTSALVASGYQDVPPDPRVRAIMPISPSINFSPEDERLLSKIEVPMLVVGGENDTITPVDPNNRIFFENSNNSFPRWNAVVSNAGHTSFSDTCVFYEIVLNSFAGGNVDTAYTLLGSGNLEEGKSRIESAYCNNTIEDTLPVLKFSAVAFFKAVLFEDPIAKNCLKGLGDGQQPPISRYQFLDDPVEKEGQNSSSRPTSSPPLDARTTSGVELFRVVQNTLLGTLVVIVAVILL